MTREVKFRLWDQTEQTMLILPTLKETVERFEYWYGRFILMQYTGLKDNSGSDIYEGDILKPKDYPKNCAVTFQNGAFVCHGGQILIDPRDWWKRIVIGNVFENPDLLK